MLGNMLLDRGIPIDIVLILMHYLRNQTARVSWGGEMGDCQWIGEGVRQGGILSPFLFKLYLDGVITEIGDMETGCIMGLFRLNIMAYADDLVIIGSSRGSLERLYLKLVEMLESLKLNINQRKTKCMIFLHVKIW